LEKKEAYNKLGDIYFSGKGV